MATSGDMDDIYRTQTLNVKRGKFLAGIPAEHQNLFRHNDRFLIHNAGLLSSKKSKDYEKVTFLPEKNAEIHIAVYEGPEPMDNYTRSCIHAYAIYSFYDVDWEKETNPFLAASLGSVITILGTYVPYENMITAGLETQMNHCHFSIVKKQWLTLNDVKEETKDIRELVATLMHIGAFDDTPQACTIVALSSLILIGKNVNEANRVGWFKNRWRALANVVNVTIDENRIEPPLLRPCQALYSSSSANQPVRSCLFRVMRTLSGISDNQTHVIFDRIIHLLQWAEMSHIWMIMEYIYDQNPDVLNFPELHGPEIAAITVAIEFLKAVPKEDRPFLKLLRDHNELKPLHSNNFIYFTAAAHAISSITKSSMLNINTRFSEGVKAFQGRIITYMHNKSRVGPLASAISYASTMPNIIQNTLIRSLEDVAGAQELPDFVDRQPEARE